MPLSPTPVVGAVLISEGRVLLCRRSARRTWRPGRWDLPGGHVEPGETPPQALVRELREELAITIAPPTGTPLATVTVPQFEMPVWVVDAWDGQVVNAAPDEHDAIGWFGPDEVPEEDLALPVYAELIRRAVTEQRTSGA